MYLCVCVHIYISKINLVSLCTVTYTYAFNIDQLVLENNWLSIAKEDYLDLNILRSHYFFCKRYIKSPKILDQSEMFVLDLECSHPWLNVKENK